MAQLPLRRYLFLLVIVGLLPLVALSGLGLISLYSQLREETLDHAREIARALATAVDAQLERSTSALQVLSTSPNLDRGDLAAFHGQARRVLATQKPQWAALHSHPKTPWRWRRRVRSS